MVKTTNATPKKKATTAKLNAKKKNSKSNFLTRRIDFRSKKVQFLVIILSFAIIGGGFMLYRSFAATKSVFTVSGLSYNKTGGYGTVSSASDAAKNNNKVLVMYAGSMKKYTIQPKVLKNGTLHKVCVAARTNSGTGNITIKFNTSDASGIRMSTIQQTASAVKSGWGSYCTQGFRTSAYLNAPAEIEVVNSGKAQLRVGLISVEQYLL